MSCASACESDGLWNTRGFYGMVSMSVELVHGDIFQASKSRQQRRENCINYPPERLEHADHAIFNTNGVAIRYHPQFTLNIMYGFQSARSWLNVTLRSLNYRKACTVALSPVDAKSTVSFVVGLKQ